VFGIVPRLVGTGCLALQPLFENGYMYCRRLTDFNYVEMLVCPFRNCQSGWKAIPIARQKLSLALSNRKPYFRRT
jgi:hypothetical protein